MRITQLVLNNWVCFAGLHTLDLTEGVYAVVAKGEDNPERSNWLGKSSFLESIVYALYGKRRKGVLEDEWITDGQQIGSVSLTIDGDLTITRTRTRGSSTKLVVVDSNIIGSLAKDEAQTHIDRLVGMSADDFFATCYFEQKRMARFVTCDASERMATIVAWLGLESLQAAEDSVKDESQALGGAIETIRRDRQVAVQLVATLLEPLGFEATPPYDCDALATELERDHVPLFKRGLENARGVLATAENDRDKLVAYRHSLVDAERYAEVIQEGATLAASINLPKGNPDAITVPAAELVQATRLAMNAAHADMRHASDEHAQKSRLARGQFDGVCPVGGIQCPAQIELNAQGVINATAAAKARNALETAQARKTQAEAAYEEAQRAQQEVARVLARLDSLRDEATRLRPSLKVAKSEQHSGKDDVAIAARVNEARQQVYAEESAYIRHQSACDKLKELAKDETRRVAELQALDAKFTVYRQAAAILGRNGAQRKIAEKALADIERGANQLLTQAGIDLRLSVAWSREGAGVAKTCDTCGAAFPASVKQKVCNKCGAARGQNTVNKLTLDLSDRSGAAEDLAGGAFQLAASAWLRHNRLTPWGVALIDEPFGALDSANRRAFAQHLTTMLRGEYGFSQAFVVAHHTSIMDALPRRIEITGTANGSTIEIV